MSLSPSMSRQFVIDQIGQIRFLLFAKASSILRTRRASFFSCTTLEFIRKNADLTDEVFLQSHRSTDVPAYLPTRYIATNKALPSLSRLLLPLNDSDRFAYSRAVASTISSIPVPKISRDGELLLLRFAPFPLSFSITRSINTHAELYLPKRDLRG